MTLPGNSVLYSTRLSVARAIYTSGESRATEARQRSTALRKSSSPGTEVGWSRPIVADWQRHLLPTAVLASH
jgi:hypothetical protein